MRSPRAAIATALLLAACAAGVLAMSAGAAESPPAMRVYLVVLDGLHPTEVGPATPTLSELKASGTWYDQARAIFPAETLPNHVAMATGMLPARNGVIGNQFWDPKTGYARQYMEHPGLLQADTIVTRLERACDGTGGVNTATIQSKTYLYNVFRGEPAGQYVSDEDAPPEPATGDPNPQRQADYHWRSPNDFYLPQSRHVSDPVTMGAFLDWIRVQPAAVPQFAFVNMGEVDRAGHADEVGGDTFGALKPLRQGAIESADVQIKRLVDELKSTGAWDETALIIVSDHSTDYGPPQNGINMLSHLQGRGWTHGETADAGEFTTVGGGGSGLVWVRDKRDIPAMAKALSEHQGVDFISVREPVPGVARQTTHSAMGFEHPRAPDIEVFAKPSWRVEDGTNPLPGNHAHPITQPSTLLVAGGHPALRPAGNVDGEAVYDPANKLFSAPAGGPGNTSIAPTVAALFGIGEPAGGYDGSPLSETLRAERLPHSAVCAKAAAGADPSVDAQAAGTPAVDQQETSLAPTGRRAQGVVSTLVKPSRSRVRAGQQVTLSGTVRADRGCTGPFRVRVEKRAHRALHPGEPVVIATSVVVGRNGRWTLRHRPDNSADYAATAQPTPACDAGSPASTTVRVLARIDLDRGGRCNRAGQISGRVVPAQPGTRLLLKRGSRTVRSTRLDRRSRFRFSVPSCKVGYRIVWPGDGQRNDATQRALAR